MLFPQFELISFVILLLPFTLASWVIEADAYSGAQYLAFNGTVIATSTYPSNAGCDPPTLQPLTSSYIYVGVDPPWDTNSFFFELYHLCSDCPDGVISYTNDSVRNLEFASSAFACWDDGEPCGFGYTFSPSWKPEVVLDLSKASVKKTKLGNEDGYEVSGDEKTYIKNETVRGTVNMANVIDQCYDNGKVWGDIWASTLWDESSTWTYSLSFSNSTATASIKTELEGSTIELTFKADRITHGAWPCIELVTEDDSKPTFRYSNGSEIHFKETDIVDGYWEASSDDLTSSVSSVQTATSTRAPSATGSATTSRGPDSTGAAEAATVKSPGTLVSFLLGLGGILLV